MNPISGLETNEDEDKGDVEDGSMLPTPFRFLRRHSDPLLLYSRRSTSLALAAAAHHPPLNKRSCNKRLLDSAISTAFERPWTY